MSLRENINKIIASDTKTDKGLLIIQYLDDRGLGLDSNGWLDDDAEIHDKLFDSELITELGDIVS